MQDNPLQNSPSQDDPQINKKKLVYIIIAVMLVITITIGTVIVLNANNKTSDTSNTVDADKLKSQAIEITKNKNGNKDQAKELLEQAKQQYESEGDTNNVVDTQALLNLLEHS
jgi:flagellar basal body-associated protein FliL